MHLNVVFLSVCVLDILYNCEFFSINSYSLLLNITHTINYRDRQFDSSDKFPVFNTSPEAISMEILDDQAYRAIIQSMDTVSATYQLFYTFV